MGSGTPAVLYRTALGAVGSTALPTLLTCLQVLGQHFYPLLNDELQISGVPFVAKTSDGCISFSVIQKHPSHGLAMDLQNCTHRWMHRWDDHRRQLGEIIMPALPVLGERTAGLLYPMNQTTVQQPFSWFGVFNPQVPCVLVPWVLPPAPWREQHPCQSNSRCCFRNF